MKCIKYFATVLIICSIASCKKSTVSTPPNVGPPVVVPIVPPPDFGFKIVGYFPYYASVAATSDSKFKMCNVVNYAFFKLDSSGNVSIINPTVFTAMLPKAKANNAKVFLSIGGAETVESTFAYVANDPTKKLNFINTTMGFVRTNNLDGVDIDWEFPRSADATVYANTMKQLGDSLHKLNKYLSAAITPGKYAGTREGINADAIAAIDFFNVMCYDDFNTSSAYVHHAAQSLVNTSFTYWLTTRAMPAQKFVLGIPAYSRPSGVSQSGKIKTYSQLIAIDANFSKTDSALVNISGTNYMLYYDGIFTVKKKTKQAQQLGNGIMFWSYQNDSNDGYSLMKAACDTIGRPY
jgi:chitinase